MQKETARILLADDDPEDQELITEFLLKEDPALIVHSVLTGVDAISWLESRIDDELPDLIILDYKMPIMNAVETLSRIKVSGKYASIPKVVWSTSMQQDHKKQCMDNGAMQYFRKPSNLEDLAVIARELLRILFHNKAGKQ